MQRPDRTWWTAKKILCHKGMDGRRRVNSELDAIMVSSLCTSGLHAPCFDLDYKASFTSPNLVGGVGNLILEIPGPIRVGPWTALSDKLQAAGLGKVVAIDWGTQSPGQLDNVVTVLLDLEVGMKMNPSSNPNHRHLYLEKEIAWNEYALILTLMKDCQWLNPGFVLNSLERKMTMLLRPGITKAVLAERGIEIEEGGS